MKKIAIALRRKLHHIFKDNCDRQFELINNYEISEKHLCLFVVKTTEAQASCITILKMESCATGILNHSSL